MQMLVVAQEEVVANIEEHANQVTSDLEQGVVHVEKALESAKGARRVGFLYSLIPNLCSIIYPSLLIIYPNFSYLEKMVLFHDYTHHCNCDSSRAIYILETQIGFVVIVTNSCANRHCNINI